VGVSVLRFIIVATKHVLLKHFCAFEDFRPAFRGLGAGSVVDSEAIVFQNENHATRRWPLCRLQTQTFFHFEHLDAVALFAPTTPVVNVSIIFKWV
jgi:hypothetical protein